MSDYPNDVTRHPLAPDSNAPTHLRVSLCLTKEAGDCRPNAERKKPVILYFQTGETLRFDSQAQSANELGIPTIRIWDIIKHGKMDNAVYTKLGVLAGAIYA